MSSVNLVHTVFVVIYRCVQILRRIITDWVLMTPYNAWYEFKSGIFAANSIKGMPRYLRLYYVMLRLYIVITKLRSHHRTHSHIWLLNIGDKLQNPEGSS